MGWKIAVVVEPCGDAGEDEASPVVGGWAYTFVVGATDVNGVWNAPVSTAICEIRREDDEKTQAE